MIKSIGFYLKKKFKKNFEFYKTIILLEFLFALEKNLNFYIIKRLLLWRGTHCTRYIFFKFKILKIGFQW